MGWIYKANRSEVSMNEVMDFPNKTPIFILFDASMDIKSFCSNKLADQNDGC